MTLGAPVRDDDVAVRVDAMTVLTGQRRRLVGPISFELRRGQRLGLRGPSGSGKSTTLRALVGLLPSPLTSHGAISVLGVDPRAKGADLPALRSRAVMAGQDPVVFPMSVLANAAFGLRYVARRTRAEIKARAQAALVEAGLWDEVADRLDAPARDLSMGQRQRLCLARALALDPDLLLLDEPTSSLDATAAAAVEESVRRLSTKRSVILVSHDASQLDRLCENVVALGTIEQPSATVAPPPAPHT